MDLLSFYNHTARTICWNTNCLVSARPQYLGYIWCIFRLQNVLVCSDKYLSLLASSHDLTSLCVVRILALRCDVALREAYVLRVFSLHLSLRSPAVESCCTRSAGRLRRNGRERSAGISSSALCLYSAVFTLTAANAQVIQLRDFSHAEKEIALSCFPDSCEEMDMSWVTSSSLSAEWCSEFIWDCSRFVSNHYFCHRSLL